MSDLPSPSQNQGLNQDPPTSPFNLFGFFKSLWCSLVAEDWFNFVQSWQAMTEVNAPLVDFAVNIEPFFANAPRLLPVLDRYLAHASKDNTFVGTLTTVLMSTPLLIKVQHILQSPSLFSDYVLALQLDCPSASHTQVMQSLKAFLAQLDEPTRLEILRVFAEEEATDMGLTNSTLDTALQLLHLDTQLYIDILSTLQLNQTENMPWDVIVANIEELVLAKKPHAWAGIDQFLKSLHWGHYQEGNDAPYTNEELTDGGIVSLVEGAGYDSDEEYEQELGSFPEGEDYDHHYAAFLQDMHDRDSHNTLDNFSQLSLSNQHQVVESC